MGQKTHPLGFRLGITQEHKSKWYANFNQYANILKEDDKIRTYINTISKANSISNVKINRNGLNDQIQLNIETGKPGILVGDLGSGLENLLNNIKKLLPSNRQVTINVFEVEKVDLDASLISRFSCRTIRKTYCF
jgi:small subunit ribosomal protein S3